MQKLRIVTSITAILTLALTSSALVQTMTEEVAESEATADETTDGATTEDAVSKAPDNEHVTIQADESKTAVEEPPSEYFEGPFRRYTITANPLSIAFVRFSLNGEYMLTKHHGLIVVPSIWYLGSLNPGFSYYGGEVGYHFYSGERGANGFFIGPSLVYTYMRFRDSEDSWSQHIYGAAFDIGGQGITRDGLTIGGGIGIMHLLTSGSTKRSSSKSPFFELEGALPRFLFMIGYSL